MDLRRKPDKRKQLQTAQKHWANRDFVRALQEYKAVSAADPKDASVGLKVAECYERVGDTAHAIDAFLRVADAYAKQGFDDRAIAVLKNILRIDHRRIDVYEKMADLCVRVDAKARAIAALREGVSFCYVEGDSRRALPLLRKLAELDPLNVTGRLKLAALLASYDELEDARAEYLAVAHELERQGEIGRAIVALEEWLLKTPNCVTSLLAIVRLLSLRGDYARAESFALRACEQAPEEEAVLLCMAELYDQLARPDAFGAVINKLESFYRRMDKTDKLVALRKKFAVSRGDVTAEHAADLVCTDENAPDAATSAADAADPSDTEWGGAALDSEPSLDSFAIDEIDSDASDQIDADMFAPVPVDLRPSSDLIAEHDEAASTPNFDPAAEGDVTLTLKVEENSDAATSAQAMPACESSQDAPTDLGVVEDAVAALDAALAHGNHAEALALCARVLQIEPTHEYVLRRLPEITKLLAPASSSTEVSPPVAQEQSAVVAEETLDLASILQDELAHELREDSPARDPLVLDTLREFRRGVNAILDETDYESHYNLGIAYYEMDLFDAAGEEFSAACAEPSRRLSCLQMIGMCELGAGRHTNAIEAFLALLGEPELSSYLRREAHSKMASAYEALGDFALARKHYACVAARDSQHLDVQERIARSDSALSSHEDSGQGRFSIRSLMNRDENKNVYHEIVP